MKLSRKSEYACLALIYLTKHFGEGYIKAVDISTKEEIPRKYLEQILLILKRHKIVHSARGAEGGYKLSRKPNQITLAEVIRMMDGALAPVESVSKYFYEHTPIEGKKKLLRIFKDIRDTIAHKLETTTLADIA
ncbi:MAG: Rrf2 family transcriptional regulator [Planctomycetota bacterium]|nr:Rrf2 family transcriptional regulator [Planctomycetota bacterium]